MNLGHVRHGEAVHNSLLQQLDYSNVFRFIPLTGLNVIDVQQCENGEGVTTPIIGIAIFLRLLVTLVVGESLILVLFLREPYVFTAACVVGKLQE